MLLGILCGLALLLVPAGASGAGFKFKETFGSAAQPSFLKPVALARDPDSGDLLVVDVEAKTISRFNADGTPDDFAALGTNVIDGEGGADETPEAGLDFGGGNPREVQLAIDNSGGPTDGDIYVTQPRENLLEAREDLIDVFATDGSYLRQITASSEGSFGFTAGLAVDPAGAVYVSEFNGTEGRIHKFLGGVNTANFPRPGFGLLAAGAGPTDGFLFADSYGAEPVKLDSASGAQQYVVSPEESVSLAVNPANGHLFNATPSQIKEYDASGPTEAKLLASFTPGGSIRGIAVDPLSGNLYVSRANDATIAVFEPVALPEALNAPADPVGATSATLHGTVNPGGLPLTECFFEWGETQSYGEIAPCVDPDAAAVGEGNAPVPVHADIADLQAGTTYHFHLVATNANGRSDEEGKEDETLRTLGPAVSGESVSQVTATTAKISATIDPNGEATGFFVEYLDEAAYLANPESERFAGALRAPASDRQVPAAVSAHGDLLDGSASVTNVAVSAGAFQAGQAISGPDIPPETTILAVPSPTELTLSKPADLTTETVKFTALTATGPQPVTQLLSGLAPQSTYYFRIVATNGAGAAARPAVSFTTFALPGALLPDGRAYELISPARKTGEVIPPEPGSNLGGSCEECLPGINTPIMPMQSTADGRSVLYEGQPFAGGLASGPNEYVSARGTGGWDTQSLSSPTTTGQYQAFSADLARGVLFQVSPPLTPQAPTREGKGFANLYLRTGDGSLQALIGSEPPHRDPGYQAVGGNQFRLTYATANAGTGAAAPFTHLAFEANDALTAAVPAIAPAAPNVDAGEGCSLAGANCNLYEWAGGQLRLVNVLPGNAAAAAGAVIGSGRLLAEAPEAEAANADHAISEDGSRIFWSSEESGQVYVRIDANRTLEVPGPGSCKESVPQEQRACFLSASADGSRVLLSDGQAYELNEAGSAYEASVDLSEGEGGFEGILGASEDLSHVYFVDTEVLGEGEENDNGEEAEAGAFNLYARIGATTTFIGALLDETYGFKNSLGAWKAAPSDRLAQVSPDGAHLALMTSARLSGYDNERSGGGACNPTQDCSEVFEYSAASGTLSCASCNPNGQRPLGPSNLSLLLPGPNSPPFRQPANLSPAGDGRLFFESRDALSPQDTNGVQDVYEWEPEGVGSCERAGGCVSLISSGRSANDSMFLDSTPSGDDAFFITREQLLPADKDEQLDLYDARVGGGFPESTAAPCGGEACKAPLLAPPFQPSPASAAFSGPGNPKPKPHKKKKQKKHKKKQKQHSRAAKHARGSLR